MTDREDVNPFEVEGENEAPPELTYQRLSDEQLESIAERAADKAEEEGYGPAEREAVRRFSVTLARLHEGEPLDAAHADALNVAISLEFNLVRTGEYGAALDLAECACRWGDIAAMLRREAARRDTERQDLQLSIKENMVAEGHATKTDAEKLSRQAPEYLEKKDLCDTLSMLVERADNLSRSAGRMADIVSREQYARAVTRALYAPEAPVGIRPPQAKPATEGP